MKEMILSDIEIENAVKTGEIEISNFSRECLQPASYDLRVGKEGFTLSAGRIISIEKEGLLEIQPGDFALIITYERLKLPTNIVGRIGLRSKYARMGLLMTAGPQVDPGFEGKLIFGLINFSPKVVRIPYLEPICTLELERLSTPSSAPYSGPYQGQEHISHEIVSQLPSEPLPLAVMLIRQLVAASPILQRGLTPPSPRTRVPEVPEAFQREREAFMRLKPQLLKTHRGEDVVIRDGKPVLFGRDKVELAREAYRRFGYIPLYIGLVQEEPEVAYIPTPKLVKRFG